LIALFAAAICLFATTPAGAIIVFSETFDSYTGFPGSSNDTGGHMTNFGVPTLAEGADSGLWLGGRFETGDGGSISSDVGVLKHGDGPSGPNPTHAGRVSDDAGLVIRLDLTNFLDVDLSFDFRTFNASGNDRFVAAYYIGDGLGTPNGTFDWYADPLYGNSDMSAAGPNGPTTPWYLANWNEVERALSPSGFISSGPHTLTGSGGNVVYIAFWLDNGDSDLGKFDNVVITGELVPEPTTFVLAGFGIAAVGFVAIRRRRARNASADVRADHVDDVASVRADSTTDMADVRADLRADVADLRADRA
jgi:hypothetical protein